MKGSRQPRLGRVDGTHIMVALVIVIAGKSFLALPRYLALRAGGAGWIALGLGAGFALGALALMLAGLARFPGKSLVMVAREVTGPVAGRLLAAPLFLGFLFITALGARQYAENFNLAVLPRTPVPFLAAAFLVLAGLTAVQGLEALVRLALLFSLIISLFLLPLLASATPLADFTNLTPLLGYGLPALAWQGLKAAGLYAEFLLLGLVAPFVRHRNELGRAGALAIGASWLVLSSIAVLTVAVLAVSGVERSSFPIFLVARAVNLGEFIERVESIFVFLWVFVAGLSMGATLFAAALALGQILDVANLRPLVPILTVLSYELSLVPLSAAEAASLDFEVLREGAWILTLGLPLVLLVLARARRKGGGGGGRSPGRRPGGE